MSGMFDGIELEGSKSRRKSKCLWSKRDLTQLKNDLSIVAQLEVIERMMRMIDITAKDIEKISRNSALPSTRSYARRLKKLTSEMRDELEREGYSGHDFAHLIGPQMVDKKCSSTNRYIYSEVAKETYYICNHQLPLVFLDVEDLVEKMWKKRVAELKDNDMLL